MNTKNKIITLALLTLFLCNLVQGIQFNEISKTNEIVNIDNSIIAHDIPALGDYDHRILITIGHESGAGTNYQIKVSLWLNSGTSSGNTIYLGGTSECQSDFDDIMFTEDDGLTELDFWIEDIVTNSGGVTYANVWVEISESLSTSDVDIYLYYGNSTDSVNDSDGAATFPTFIDKDTTTGWTKTSCTVQTSNDYLWFYNNLYGTSGMASRSISTPDDFMFMARYKTVSLGSYDRASNGLYDGTTANRFALSMTPYQTAQSNWYYYDGAFRNGGSWTEGTERISTITVDEGDTSTGISYRMYSTSWSLQSSAVNKAIVGGSPTDCDGLYIGDTITTGYCSVFYKWIIIRAWISSEPTIDSVGSIEDSGYDYGSINHNPTIDSVTEPAETMYINGVQEYTVSALITDVDGIDDLENVMFSMTNSLEWPIFRTNGINFRLWDDNGVFSYYNSEGIGNSSDYYTILSATETAVDSDTVNCTFVFVVDDKHEYAENMRFDVNIIDAHDGVADSFGSYDWNVVGRLFLEFNRMVTGYVENFTNMQSLDSSYATFTQQWFGGIYNEWMFFLSANVSGLPYTAWPDVGQQFNVTIKYKTASYSNDEVFLSHRMYANMNTLFYDNPSDWVEETYTTSCAYVQSNGVLSFGFGNVGDENSGTVYVQYCYIYYIF